MLGVGEVLGALREMRGAVRSLNPHGRVALCVVPQPPAGAAGSADPLAAVEDRAALRAAAGEAARWPGFEYLPILEALSARTDPLAAAFAAVRDVDLDAAAEAVAAALAAPVPAAADGGA